MAEHYQHEHFRIAAAFTDTDGAAADPTVDVEYTIVAPDATVSELTYTGTDITKSATGSYYYDYLPSQYGEFEIWVKGEGTIDVIEKTTVSVRQSRDELA